MSGLSSFWFLDCKLPQRNINVRLEYLIAEFLKLMTNSKVGKTADGDWSHCTGSVFLLYSKRWSIGCKTIVFDQLNFSVSQKLLVHWTLLLRLLSHITLAPFHSIFIVIKQFYVISSVQTSWLQRAICVFLTFLAWCWHFSVDSSHVI